MAQHLDIPPYFYGELIRTTARVVTWNVWGLYGPWQEREAAITSTLLEARPDLLVLAESWSKGDDSQSARLAGPWGCRTTPSAGFRRRRTSQHSQGLRSCPGGRLPMLRA
ncbi:endonuclease/exonuclease/phosphatase family protein [Arthrobacter sp. SD76]|uniref:endonuclease/exonuclease/phosphatase family protein n=1 Tax=Arthrobacter sp. SD76 TaxID=3415007 RepID=UPI003C795B29